MKKNSFKIKANSSVERMLFLLPKSCDCNTCQVTKNFIKKELGEAEFFSVSKQIGLNV